MMIDIIFHNVKNNSVNRTFIEKIMFTIHRIRLFLPTSFVCLTILDTEWAYDRNTSTRG